MKLEVSEPFQHAIVQHWDKPAETLDIVQAELFEQTNVAHATKEEVFRITFKVCAAFAISDSPDQFINRLRTIPE